MAELIWAIMGFTFGGIIGLIGLFGGIIWFVDKCNGQDDLYGGNVILYLICSLLLIGAGFLYLNMHNNPIGG